MDKQPTQLVKESRQPFGCEPGKLARYDYECERNKTANSFMVTEPLEGWRKVSVREKKTRQDWAEEVQRMLDEDCPDAELVILVRDNLNSYTLGALHETFPPKEAKRLADRLDIRYTPKHGSWLNMAEMELSVLTKQCLSCRIADIEKLRREAAAWAERRNQAQTDVN